MVLTPGKVTSRRRTRLDPAHRRHITGPKDMWRGWHAGVGAGDGSGGCGREEVGGSGEGDRGQVVGGKVGGGQPGAHGYTSRCPVSV